MYEHRYTDHPKNYTYTKLSNMKRKKEKEDKHTQEKKHIESREFLSNQLVTRLSYTNPRSILTQKSISKLLNTLKNKKSQQKLTKQNQMKSIVYCKEHTDSIADYVKPNST